MRAYPAAISTSAGLSVSIPMSCRGKSPMAGKKDGDGPRHITANPHDPVDTLHIALAPILADQHRGPALQAEDDQLDHKDRHVGSVTAARGASPSAPTMKVSISPSEVVIRFWRMIGTASVTTPR